MNRIEVLFSPFAAPVRLLAGLPATVTGLILAALAVLPFLVFPDVDFRSDDILVLARGAEDAPAAGLRRWFSSPFLDTRTMELYRPLFSWWFCLGADVFGASPRPFFLVNLGWHALSILLGFLLLRRLVGAEAAVTGTLLAAASPWAANNVEWLVGHVTVTATVTVCGVALLHLRRVERRRSSLPWLGTAVLLVGIFYRETAVLAVGLVFLIDLVQGRRDRLAVRDAAFLCLPFAIYAAACRMVMGQFPPAGYARFRAALGGPSDDATLMETMAAWGETVLAVTTPHDGALLAPEYTSPARIAALVALALVMALSLVGRGWLRGATWALLVFAAVNAGIILWADDLLTGSNSQRWHTVVWALGGVLGAVAAHARLRNAATTAVLVLAALNAMRLVDDLDDYQESARFMRAIRAAVREAPEDVVLLHNVPDFVGASPFLPIGAGMVAAPPFGRGDKEVFSISANRRYAADERAQTPVAVRLLRDGVPFTALWCDPVARGVAVIPAELIAGVGAHVASLPRLDVLAPTAPTVTVGEEFVVRLRARGLARIDVRIVSPLTEMRYTRLRGVEYVSARFRGEGEREVFVERLGYALESGAFSPGVPGDRCFLWLVGYADEGGESLAGVSDIYELRFR